MLEFTYPPGSAFIPIANWETKATLSLKNLPSHLSICSSVFLKGWAADVGTLFSFFQLLDHDRLEGTIRNVDDSWAELRLESGQLTRETKITAFMGLKDEKVEITAKEKLPLYFAQSWIRACMSLDTTTGTVGEDCGGGVLSEQETGGQAGYDGYGERGVEVLSRPPSSIKSAPSRLKRDDLGFYTEHYTDVKQSMER